MEELDFSATGLLLEEVQKNVERPALFAEIGDDAAASSDSLLDAPVIVKLRESAPGAKLLPGFDHHNVDLALGAECLDELLVLLVLAVLGKAAEACRAPIQRLRAFVKTLLETTMDHSLLKNLQHKT